MQTSAVSVKWITGRNFDLLFYIGACITGYILIYLNLALGISALLLWWIWIMAVDGPHVFATISRTYLDLEEWQRRAQLLFGSLLWFLLGPSVLLVARLYGNLLPFVVFLIFAQLWAYWHVVRQHYGFMVLYQKKNGEAAGKQNQVDYWIFYFLMIAPFFSFLLRHPQARIYFGLAQNFTSLERQFLLLLHASIAAAVLIYLANEIYQFRRGKQFNLPKNLFLLACIPLHLLIFLHPYISTHLDINLFAVFVTFYHNIQYHGIVWFYNKNRYGQQDANRRFGLASRVSRTFLTYYAAGIVFTLTYRSANWFFTRGVDVAFSVGPGTLGSMTEGQLLAVAFWWGFAFNHYYLDQKIWKLSKDQQLTRDLKVAVAT